MPKLHLSIHIDQHGLQTINSDGDPSLWPLVGRLAACHPQATIFILKEGQPPQPVDVSSTPMSSLAHQIAEHAWFSELWSRTTERPLLVGETMIGRRFAVLDSDDSRLTSASEELQATRAILEEAIGRTPDPARSTKQLALDLVEVLKAAVAAR